MRKELTVKSLKDLPQAAQEFLSLTKGKKIFAFNGKMGAGKTTFIKALCSALEVEDNVCSPTFAILNVYLSRTEGEIYHFDFYRLEDEMQALDIGVEENFYSGNFCFLEWAEKIPSLLPTECVFVDIEETKDGERKISFSL
ncbi:MAG: tRNA (adenosine(37)-N6)-threonylcarbamoyltransferase complex ATPase subunit type 1 TsaE [Bacteroidales bacterium]|nr:tRNA (adenosine(37)-N6)-threonylcarbamoyltransferase complex ATPase subunit type 1 TsaE [Bacteroidales bacterium]